MTTDDSQPKYPIRAVVRLSGIGLDTLRAWERRHKAVTPARDERGRMYTDDDIKRLRLLKEAVGAGHAIGRAAGLTNAQLEALVATHAHPSEPPRHTEATAEFDLTMLSRALMRFDVATIEAFIGRAAALLPAPELLRQVVVPALKETGDAWCDKRTTVAHEHLLSTVVRNVLGSLLRLHPHAQAPGRLLFATPSGERHELGTLGAATLAASGGLDAVFLGAELPAADVIAAASAADADVVVLGVTAAAAADDIRQEVIAIAHGLQADTELWLGGPSAGRIAPDLGARVLVVDSYEALQSQLTRVGARW